jgi:hypothetical protein
MQTINDSICCTPFPFNGTQTEVRASGLKQVSNYSGLVPLTVLASTDFGVVKGDTVYVSGKDVKNPYAIARYKLGDVECIFVPKAAVLLRCPAYDECKDLG